MLAPAFDGRGVGDEDNPKLRNLIQEATDAIGREDWDAAVDGMRRAVDASREAPTIAAGKRNLAVVLYSRGMRAAERAMTRINEVSGKASETTVKTRVGEAARSRHRRSWKVWLSILVVTLPVAWLLYPLYRADEVWINPSMTRLAMAAMVGLLGTLLIRAGVVRLAEAVSDSTDAITAPGTAPKCWACGSGASYRIDVPGHGERLFCHQHAQRVEMAMQGVTADGAAIKLLESARKDLTEARELDPQLEEAGKLLGEVRGILSKLGRS